MDNDDREMLERILKLSEENSRKIKYLYRTAVWSSVWSFIYWAVIIGLGIGAFYYLQPYINAANNLIHLVTGSGAGQATSTSAISGSSTWIQIFQKLVK